MQFGEKLRFPKPVKKRVNNHPKFKKIIVTKIIKLLTLKVKNPKKNIALVFSSHGIT